MMKSWLTATRRVFSPRSEILLRRRTLVLPTWKGWGLITIGLILLGGGILEGLPGYLAPHAPLGGEILVVEGWIADENIPQVIERFRSGKYRRLVTTGGPITHGSLLVEFDNFARLMAESLEAHGLEGEKITAVPAPRVARGRSLASARAFEQWRRSEEPDCQRIDLLSLGVHGRRSRMLYRRVVASTCEVGVISQPDPRFEGLDWWLTSAGFKAILNETIALVYAFIFSK